MDQKTYVSPRGEVAYWISRHPDPDASCIVFLHGLTADHTLFDFQVPYFSVNCTVVTWDAPAHALSRPYRDFSYANCVEDLFGILSVEGIRRAVFAGQSFGGYLVQAFLLRHTEMCLAFIAIDTSPFGTRYYSASDLYWMKQTGAISRWIPFQSYKNLVIKSVSVTETGRENMKKALSFYDKREFCELMDVGIGDFAHENCDLKINCPVLILVGECDRAGKVLATSKAWHEATGYPLVIIKNAAHNSNIDQPEKVNAIIDEFLSDALS